MKRKILLAIPTIGMGGAQRFLMELVKRLDKRRFSMIVLVLCGREGSFFEGELDKRQVKVVYLNKKLGFSLRTVFQIIRIFFQYRPDVVHSNLHVLPYLLPAVLLKRPAVRLHTVHSMAEKETTGVSRLLSRFAFRFCGFLPVAVGKDVQKSIMQLYHRKNVPCIQNGVAPIKLEKKRQKKNADIIQIVSVGALWPPKNHVLLIEAMHKACLEEERLRLTIYGEGILRKELEEKICQYGLTERISLPGNTDRIEAALLSADIFAISSDFEGMPFCVLEALSCRLPVIGTRVGGITELVRDGVNGFLCPRGDANAFAKAILTVAGDEKLRNRMGRASLKFQKYNDIWRMVKGYEKLYEGQF